MHLCNRDSNRYRHPISKQFISKTVEKPQLGSGPFQEHDKVNFFIHELCIYSYHSILPKCSNECKLLLYVESHLNNILQKTVHSKNVVAESNFKRTLPIESYCYHHITDQSPTI